MNTYWPVYRRLEESTLHLAEMVRFNDEQLKIYSPFIGDLIVRCSIEIESLSKDLYTQLSGKSKILDTSTGHERNPYFDTDCLALLVDKWKIDKKKIQVTNHNMYFSKEKSILMPLHKSHRRGTSGSNWKKAYQGIKHNRSQEITAANIENLLSVLGALYILNLYYKKESYWDNVPISMKKPYTNDSEIFTPFIYDATHIHMNVEMGDDYMDDVQSPTRQECVYLKKFTNENVREIHEIFCVAEYKSKHDVLFSKQYLDYIQTHGKNSEEKFNDILRKIGIDIAKVFRKNLNFGSTLSNLISTTEIVLNDEGQIYPRQTFDDFLQTDIAKKIENDAVEIFNRNGAKSI